MLGELEGLALIIRLQPGAIERGGAARHRLIDQPADDLAVLDDEGHVARAHLQHGARALPAGSAMAEAGIEEACGNVRYDMFPSYLKDDPIPLI